MRRGKGLRIEGLLLRGASTKRKGNQQYGSETAWPHEANPDRKLNAINTSYG
jgi:hypothetical protein